MNEGNRGRYLPNRFMLFFFLAVEEQMGRYSLHMMLRQAGLERYIDRFPPRNRRGEIGSREFANFQKEFRAYYGQGARGSLNRIGRRIFHWMVKDASIPDRIRLLWIRLIPATSRRKKGLEWLARQLRDPGGKLSVHTLDLDLVFVIHTSDIAVDQSTSDPICWMTVGMLQEALLWATDEEPDIEELSCQAAGQEACTFRIKLSG